jgi:Protein of unknown function DUF86
MRWREVYGFRNIAAHAYLDIDIDRVWEIVTDHLPPLRTAVEKELARPSAYLTCLDDRVHVRRPLPWRTLARK